MFVSLGRIFLNAQTVKTVLGVIADSKYYCNVLPSKLKKKIKTNKYEYVNVFHYLGGFL